MPTSTTSSGTIVVLTYDSQIQCAAARGGAGVVDDWDVGSDMEAWIRGRGIARLSAEDARTCALRTHAAASGNALSRMRRRRVGQRAERRPARNAGHPGHITGGNGCGTVVRDRADPGIAWTPAHTTTTDRPRCPGGTQNVIWPDTMKVTTLKLLAPARAANASFAERVSYESVVSIRVWRSGSHDAVSE
jgi:hypothetical protein